MPTIARTDLYQGHLSDGSSVQIHSCDAAYAQHRIVMQAVEAPNGRRLWQATRFGKVLFSHRKHDTALNAAISLLIGA